MTHAHAAPARSTKNATAHNFMKPLEAKIHKYLKDRNWHNLRPVDVAKSIMIEGAELLELFQWENRTLEEVKKSSKEHKAAIGKELADVLLYAIELSILMGFDTEKIIRAKLALVQKKYPAKAMRKRAANTEPGTDSEYLRIKEEYRKQGKQ